MPEFECTVTIKTRVTAATAADARLLLVGDAWGLTKPTAPLSVTVRADLVRPPDVRIIAHLPNLPRLELESKLMSLSDIEMALIDACIQPREAHTAFLAVRAALPDAPLTECARALSALKNRGWIQVVRHNVERDSFPNLSTPQGEAVRAQFTALSDHAR